MAFIRYFSHTNSDCLFSSFVPLLEESGITIPNYYKNSKQLFAEYISKEDKTFSKVNVLISWVDQSNKKCSVEIWSDEPFCKKDTLCKKVHQKISELIPPK